MKDRKVIIITCIILFIILLIIFCYFKLIANKDTDIYSLENNSLVTKKYYTTDLKKNIVYIQEVLVPSDYISNSISKDKLYFSKKNRDGSSITLEYNSYLTQEQLQKNYIKDLSFDKIITNSDNEYFNVHLENKNNNQMEYKIYYQNPEGFFQTININCVKCSIDDTYKSILKYSKLAKENLDKYSITSQNEYFKINLNTTFGEEGSNNTKNIKIDYRVSEKYNLISYSKSENTITESFSYKTENSTYADVLVQLVLGSIEQRKDDFKNRQNNNIT